MSTDKHVRVIDITGIGTRVPLDKLGAPDGPTFAYAQADSLPFHLSAPIYLNRPDFAKVFPAGPSRRPAPMLCAVRSCFLFGPAGFVVLPDGQLVRQSVMRFDAGSLNYSFGQFKAQFPGTHIMWTSAEETVYAANGYSANNYFHFLADALGQMHWRERAPWAGKARAVISGYSPEAEEKLPFIAPALEAAGVTAAERYPFDGTILFCRHVIFPMRDTGATPERVAYIRKRLGLENAPRGKARLYVVRGTADRRRVLNEDKVQQVLAGHGFASVNPGALSFADQVKLFADAAIVVGAHGAGLTNAMFMAPGGALVELTQTGRVVATFHEVASAAGLSYACVVNDRHDNETGMPLFADQMVDLDALEAAVQAVVKVAG